MYIARLTRQIQKRYFTRSLISLSRCQRKGFETSASASVFPSTQICFVRNYHKSSFLKISEQLTTAGENKPAEMDEKIESETKCDAVVESIKPDTTIEGNKERGTKRAFNEENLSETKKVKEEEASEQADASTKRPPYKKKKVGMMLVYSGKGYVGMQKNPGVRTIEDELLESFVKAGIVTADHASDPGRKMDFQRAARTDKGVSAAGQLVSLKMFIDVEDAVNKINSYLPKQIRILGFKRTTKGFDSKNSCCYRTYQYMLPTFAFTPVEEHVLESHRTTEATMERVNEVLSIYKGTHNFHNFTSGKKPDDKSAVRYIMDFKCGSPFVRQGMEFAVITVRGQSFVLHQIRKMIGMMIAIVRGLAGKEAIDRAWEPPKADIPIAPALGLYLDKTHYDVYNKRYGKDGLHDVIEWDQYKEERDKFKEDFLYSNIIETEKTQKSMLMWLGTLPKHHFGEKRPDELAWNLNKAGQLLRAESQTPKEEKDCTSQEQDKSSSNTEEVEEKDTEKKADS